MKRLEKLKILIVDDEALLREILADEFKYEGAQVVEAENGRKAFQIVQSGGVDVVLTDVRMPGGDGIELLKNVRGLDPTQPPVFLVTGFADITEAQALGLGASAMFSKPYDSEELIQAVAAKTRKKP